VPVATLKNEVTLLAHLHHPNLLVFHGLSSTNGTRGMFDTAQWHIVTEFCPATLEQVFTLTQFTGKDFRHFGTQICRGLQYLHNVKHIAHRDIKPQNLLITSSGDLRIADLGLSKMCRNNKAHTAELGTVAFMAPETMDATNLRIDPFRADMYSLGLVLWCMWTCTRDPYPQFANFAQIVNAVTTGARPKFEQNDQQLPAAVRSLVRKLWGRAKDRPLLEAVLITLKDSKSCDGAILNQITSQHGTGGGVAQDMPVYEDGEAPIGDDGVQGSTCGDANGTKEAGVDVEGSGVDRGFLSREYILCGKESSWRDAWDGSVGQKLVFADVTMAF
jgi:serine/threonine protein kinase